MPKKKKYLMELKKIYQCKEIPDGCAEFFPFEIIDELQSEYL